MTMTLRHHLTASALAATAALAVSISLAAPAHAGRGASAATVERAIQSNVPSAIIGEIERAEYLWCGSRCIDAVMALLDHPDYSVREVAAWWFARRPAQRREIAERAAAYLAGNDSVLARNAADALGTFRHPDAIAPLAAAAARADLAPEARHAAVRALGTIGDLAAAPAIARAMGDADAEVRAEAVRAWLALRGQRSAAPVVALVADADPLVRREASAVVGNLRAGDARLELERRLAEDLDSSVRRNAAWALGRIGDPRSRAALEAATGDASGLVRGVARAALAELAR
jgi:HEAT repeat protein